jgi:2-oxoglutarate dehydrogenase E1 component
MMQQSSMELFRRSSHIAGGNATYVEDLYESYLRDPNGVPEQWRDYFDKLPRVESKTSLIEDVPHSALRERFARISKMRVRTEATVAHDAQATQHERKQVRVLALISAYRQRGHQKANLDPLGLAEREHVADLELGFHELSIADLDTPFQVGSLHIGRGDATLKEIIDALERTYCHTVGAEFMHIVDTEQRHWIMQRMEAVRSAPDYGPDIQLQVLRRLIKAEGLEKSLGSKFPGTKRFGLEGGESLIPMLAEMIQRIGSYHAKEIVIGMAHRGRLNVLVNILGKKPSELFAEFEGKATYDGSGDVKYHQGFSSNVMTPGGEVHLALAFNPSHLEIVAPVVEGSVRARQERRGDPVGEAVWPIVIHGDAAFAGQGVVMETFQMSQTRAYKTGGTVHIVLNNQVGFTTSRREDARSTEYCTDVAKMVQAPIFHVNADDPQAVLFVTQMAIDYRNEFKRDVVIDLVCYRRRGHNEADEPSVTQPLMYTAIREHPSTRDLYARTLIERGAITEAEDQALVEAYRDSLDRDEPLVSSLVTEPNKSLFVDWTPYLGHEWTLHCETGMDLHHLQSLAHDINVAPDNFPLQRQVSKILEDRRKMAAGAMPLNWGFAETLAYASLLEAGLSRALDRTGRRPRHLLAPPRGAAPPARGGDLCPPAARRRRPGGVRHLRLAPVRGGGAGLRVRLRDHFTDGPGDLGGAVRRLCQRRAGGDRPVHHQWRTQVDASVRPDNAAAARLRGAGTGAQLGATGAFHAAVRRAQHPGLRAIDAGAGLPHAAPPGDPSPAQTAVVMSPKSLLRHKEAVSTLEDLANGRFHNVLDETDDLDKDKVERIILCAGKVFYDLRAARRERGVDNIAIIRLEQLYPFPEAELLNVLSGYRNIRQAVWCQEEPMNQGAWYSSQHHMRRVMFAHAPEVYLDFAGREASAAPAAGYMALHLAQQEAFINQALTVA